MQASESVSSTPFRYISENIQFSRMRNVILPQFTSQLYSYGYNDFISDVPVQIDDKQNAYESSFYMDSGLYTQEDQLDGTLAFCCQSSTNNYQSGPSSLMTIENLDLPSFGARHLSTKFPTVSNNYDNNIKQQQLSHLQRQLPKQLKENAIYSRKRPIQKSDVIQKTSSEIVVGNKPPESEWTSNKKRAVCCQEQLQDCQIRKEIKEVQRERVPVRRSQKLADRVTALQKLVSPYGKTDTASVLHEASIFIKILQDQIENMLHSLSSSPDSMSPQQKMTGEKEFDLRNKELCLIPVSLTRELMMEDSFNQHRS